MEPHMPKSMTAAAAVLIIALLATTATRAADWPPERQKDWSFTDRKVETYTHGVRPEWGYAAPQRDTFLVLHPKAGPRPNAPLYVVLHSAGHDVHTCLACTD